MMSKNMSDDLEALDLALTGPSFSAQSGFSSVRLNPATVDSFSGWKHAFLTASNHDPISALECSSSSIQPSDALLNACGPSSFAQNLIACQLSNPDCSGGDLLSDLGHVRSPQFPCKESDHLSLQPSSHQDANVLDGSVLRSLDFQNLLNAPGFQRQSDEVPQILKGNTDAIFDGNFW
eukprot:Sdes_comp20044_c0_seq1m12861